MPNLTSDTDSHNQADNLTYAKDCKCIVCGKPAVAFWPCIDPDIPDHPYCRKCLDEQEIQVMINAFGMSKNEAQAMLKFNALRDNE